MSDLVLMCGNDPDLSSVRTLVLSKIARVRNLPALEGIRSVCENDKIQLAVLCHTLSDFEKETAVDIIRSRCKDASILILNTAYNPRDSSESYQVFDIDKGPEALLEKCKALIADSRCRASQHIVSS